VVPNAAIRRRRQPLRVASDAARVHLAAGIDANWRGAYDILVRPHGQQLDLEKTNGLVEPNFLGFTGAGGIAESQLDAIRRIAGVELAAPVSVVGYLSYTQSAPIVYRSDAPPMPTIYRLPTRAT
jgi:putative ABC transport system permease protein